MTRLRTLIQKFARSASGSATVEFVVLFPLIISILMMGTEAGWTSVQRVSLDRAVDRTVRDLRVGNLAPGVSHNAVRTHLCERASLLVDCEQRLLLELRVINTGTWTFPSQQSDCINLASPLAPVTPFTIGLGESVMFLRACYLVRPMFPTTGYGLRLPLDGSGMYALRTVTGFIVE